MGHKNRTKKNERRSERKRVRNDKYPLKTHTHNHMKQNFEETERSPTSESSIIHTLKQGHEGEQRTYRSHNQASIGNTPSAGILEKFHKGHKDTNGLRKDE